MPLINDPTDIANCILWCEADQGVTLDGSSNVSQWNDLSGNGNHLTQSTSGKRPPVVTDSDGYSALDFTPNATASLSHGLAIPSGVTWNSRAMTVIIIATTDAPTEQRVLIQPGAGSSLAVFQTLSSKIQIFDGSLKPQAYFPPGFASTRANWWMRCGASQTEVGYNDTRDTVTLLNSATSSGGLLGDFSTANFGWNGKIYAIAAWTRELTFAELRDVRRYFDRKYRNPSTPLVNAARNQLICVGDSLTWGASAGSALGDYPSQIKRMLGGTVQITNLGVPASQIAAMDTLAADYADPLIDDDFHRNWLVFWGGTNNLHPSLGNQSAATAYSAWSSLVSNRVAEGYDAVYCLNCLPRNEDATFAGRRSTFNSSIASGVAGLGGILVDIAGNPLIGDDGDETNTTYYNADEVHLLTAGQKQVALELLQKMVLNGWSGDGSTGRAYRRRPYLVGA